MGHPAKVLIGKPVRGFESLTLRIGNFKYRLRYLKLTTYIRVWGIQRTEKNLWFSESGSRTLSRFLAKLKNILSDLWPNPSLSAIIIKVVTLWVTTFIIILFRRIRTVIEKGLNVLFRAATNSTLVFRVWTCENE